MESMKKIMAENLKTLLETHMGELTEEQIKQIKKIIEELEATQ